MVRCLIMIRDFYRLETSSELIWDEEKPLDQHAKKILKYWVRIGRLSRLLDDQYWGFLGAYGETKI